MGSKKIWISPPHMGGNEQKYIQAAFESNYIAPEGDNLLGFEKDIECYLGNHKYVAALNSGTAAIHLGLILLGVGPGDIVICQSMTFSASVNPILYVGATPVFIDSEMDTWNLCPLALETSIIDCISKGLKPKVIITVHCYGVPYKVDEIHQIASKYSIPILEDSAEALGSSYKGRKCGTFGDIGVFSFNGNKIITTSGGGAIITKSKELKNKAIFYATQAKENVEFYQHKELGYNYRLSNICAGIGRAQMEVLNLRITQRRLVHEFYVNLFQKIEGVSVFKVPNDDYFSNCWLTTITLNSDILSEINSEYLHFALKMNNIESRPLWKPMHLQPVFQKYPFYGNTNSEELFRNGLCLPSGSNLTQDDQNRIKYVVNKIFDKNK